MPDQQNGRPDQIELLLDHQRPEMQHRAWIGGLGEIVVAAAPEIEIRDRAEGCDHILGQALEMLRREPQRADEKRAEDGHEGSGKQPPDSPFIKAPDRKATVLRIGQHVP